MTVFASIAGFECDQIRVSFVTDGSNTGPTRSCGPAAHNCRFEIDATGLECPEPLLLVRNKVREIAAGESVYVRATDPSTHRDFTNFCRFMGHELVCAETVEGVHVFIIRKGSR